MLICFEISLVKFFSFFSCVTSPERNYLLCYQSVGFQCHFDIEHQIYKNIKFIFGDRASTSRDSSPKCAEFSKTHDQNAHIFHTTSVTLGKITFTKSIFQKLNTPERYQKFLFRAKTHFHISKQWGQS